MSEDSVMKNLINKKDYVLNWLCAEPAEPEAARGGVDLDKRLEILLAALSREKEKNVLRFKPRKK